MVQEAQELKHVPAQILLSKAEVEAHNVSHLPFRSGALRVSVAEDSRLVVAKLTRKRRRQNRYGQPEDRAHDTLPVLIVRGRKSKGIWSHPVTSKGVVHPYPARALMDDLDFMRYRRVILKSDQEPSIVALCDAVKNGWHGEIVPEASPKGESKGNGEVERAVQSVHGLARTLKDFLEQQSGITLESRSPLLDWLVEHCSNLLLLFHKGEPHDGHTAYMRLKGKRWRVELPSFGALTTESALDTSWSRSVIMEVRVKTTERIVMDMTGTYVVQSVRRVQEEQQHDHRLLHNVRGTPREPNPGDV